MDKNLLHKINKANYLILENTLLYFGIGYTIPIINNYNIFNIGSLLIIMSLLSKYNHLISSTKEFEDIRKLYKIVIENYSHLIQTYELTNPYEIFSLYQKTLYGGYLSHNKKYNFTTDGTISYPNFLAPNILTGNGTCRHNTPFLTDILNIQNIESYNLLISTPTLTVKEFSFNYIYGVNNIVLNILKYDKDIFNNPKKNHAITISNYMDETYYMDPTNKVIYEKNDDLLVSDYFAAYVPYQGLKKFDKTVNKKRINEFRSQLTANTHNGKRLIDETNYKIDSNIDVLEKFYNEHQELYMEATDIIKRIHKK